MKTALITGVSGQDGALLARQLAGDGMRIIGTTRTYGVDLWRLEALGVRARVELVEANLAEEGVVARLLRHYAPDEIYHLAGESSVGDSLKHPHTAIDFSARSALHLVETLRVHSAGCRLLLTASIQCFDAQDGVPVTEQTPFAPLSPYAAGKTAATMIARAYRASFGTHVAVAFLGNHESRLRGRKFVTNKVVHGAAHVAAGRLDKLKLGNLDVERDWGYAPEYVDGMIRALRHHNADEFIFATGQTHKLEEFVARAFQKFGLDWRDHVEIDQSLLRPVDPPVWRLDPSKAERVLGWKASWGIDEIIEEMAQDAL